jgi:glucuronoarabinoxylan endo-1,4-beta-xylanase
MRRQRKRAPKIPVICLILIWVSGCGPKQGKTKTPSPQAAVNVTINGSKEFQTIEGFGGTEHWLFPPASEFARIFDDLGASLIRFRLLQFVESVPDMPGDETRDNDNDNPFVIDWTRVNLQWFDTLAPFLQAAQSRGAKLFGNIMSPPPWMKTNNSVDGHGSLKSGYEDELVEFILIWIKGMQTYHNVHIDYVNFENEPNYERDYDGCVLTADQVRDLTKRLGQRLAQEGLDTQIVPPETSNLHAFNLGFANSICQDSSAGRYVYALTTHSYNIDFFRADQNIEDWKISREISSGFGKPLWLTEYCLDYDYGAGPRGSWLEAINLVQHVHNALVYGNVSAWLYHELYRDPSKTPIALFDPDPDHPGTIIVYPKFYALKQYFRYVRPGAVRIDVQSSDNNILVTAFNHKTNKKLTIVAINRKDTSENLTFGVSGVQPLSQLDVIRTSQAENAVGLEPVLASGNTFSYSLPAHSITTFIGVYGAAPSP